MAKLVIKNTDRLTIEKLGDNLYELYKYENNNLIGITQGTLKHVMKYYKKVLKNQEPMGVK